MGLVTTGGQLAQHSRTASGVDGVQALVQQKACMSRIAGAGSAGCAPVAARCTHPAELNGAQGGGDQLQGHHLLVHGGDGGACAMR